MKINIRSASISTILTIILITAMTIYSESNKIFKDLLTGLTGHHWISKGAISVLFFLLAYFVFSNVKDKENRISQDIWQVILTSIACAIVIFVFFLYEYFY